MILKAFGLALLGAVIAFILKAFGWKGAPLAAVAAMIALFSFFFEGLSKIFEIFTVATEVEGGAEVGEYLMKILGIGYLSGICSDVCKELGESGIASLVVTVAKLESFAIVAPLIVEILTLGLELVQ